MPAAATRLLTDVANTEDYLAHGVPSPGTIVRRPGVARALEAVVSDGKVITSRGPGTAMDFALTLIQHLLGDESRRAVETPLVRA